MEKVLHVVVKQPFLQLLDVNVVEFLADFRVVDVDTIVLQFAQHIAMLGYYRLRWNLAHIALFLLEVDHNQAKRTTTSFQGT